MGYGANPPIRNGPTARALAINFVMNYEEGSEASVLEDDEITDTNMTRGARRQSAVKGRDLAAESMFEYGSRVGFWRLMRLFQERKLPMTVFACALAVERNPEAARRRSASPASTYAGTAGAGSVRTISRGARARTLHKAIASLQKIRRTHGRRAGTAAMDPA